MTGYVLRTIVAERSSDGATYAVSLPDGTTRAVSAALFEALFTPYKAPTLPATPAPLPPPAPLAEASVSSPGPPGATASG